MTRLQAIVAAPWSAGARVQATLSAPWTAGSRLQSIGTPYTPPNTGTPVVVGVGQGATYDIKSRNRYETHHAFSVVDLRTGDPLDVMSVSLSLDDGSAFWQLSASAPFATLEALRTGEQPAQVEVSINSQKWRFVVDTRSSPRGFASSNGTFGGRSIAALADSPYQFDQQWTNDAQTSAAQFSTLAQTNTGLEVDWRVVDWFVPENAWSISGSPWSVLQQAADAAGAVVEADKIEFKARVTSRYPTLPNTWATSAPDVQIAWPAVESDSISIIDKPAIDGVLVTGRVGGAALIRLAGTSGSNQGQMISDALLTEVPGLIERGRSILASAGGGLLVTRTLQILSGVGEPGVIDRGAMVRWVDPDETWVGMVRSVNVNADFDSARQTIGCERRTKFVVGSIAPPPVGPTPLDPNYLWTLTDGSYIGAGVTTLESDNQIARWVVSAGFVFIFLRSATAISGKTYCEFAATARATLMPSAFGVQSVPLEVFFNGNGSSIFSGNGGCGLPAAGYTDADTFHSSSAYSFVENDRIGIAFDPATGKVWFRKNGAWISGDPAAGTSPTATIATGGPFYFTVSTYRCNVSGTFDYAIYPTADSQNYQAPAGFTPYQP